MHLEDTPYRDYVAFCISCYTPSSVGAQRGKEMWAIYLHTICTSTATHLFPVCAWSEAIDVQPVHTTRLEDTIQEWQ